MAEELTFDERGRVTIPSKLRRSLGTHVVAIQTPRGILLRSVPRHVRLGVAAQDATGEGAAMDEVE